MSSKAKSKTTKGSPVTLEEAELLRGVARIRHWCQERPFNGIRLSSTAEFGETAVSFEGVGNICRMPR